MARSLNVKLFAEGFLTRLIDAGFLFSSVKKQNTIVTELLQNSSGKLKHNAITCLEIQASMRHLI